MTLRHPRAVLAVAALVLVVLGMIGIGVEGRLDPTTLDIPGTDSSRANQLLREHFGDTAPFVILLRGPAAAIDRQGPELIRALRRDPKVTTLSPWDRGNVSRLRPDPRRALILADFHVDIKTAVNDTVDQLNGILEETDPRSGPRHPDRLRHHLAGDPGRIDLLQRARRADRLAVPAARPAARLPLADRGGDPARLRRDHGASPRAGSSSSSPPGSASTPSR